MTNKIKEIELVAEDYAMTVLKDAESVLMRRISRMREGKPRTAAQARLASIRKAFLTLSNKLNDYEFEVMQAQRYNNN